MNNKSQKLIERIKGKKNKGVNNKYVLRLTEEYFDNDYFKDLFKKDIKLILKNKKFNETVKKIRKELYKVYGVFQVKRQNKKNILLDKLKNTKNLNEVKEISKEILKLHSSTRERLNEYEKIYSSIFKITGKPKSIIDLGCGLNPVFSILMDFKGNYFGYDISSNDADFLNDYFKSVKGYGINGKAFATDIKKINKYPKSDVYFLLKTIDLFGRNKKKIFNDIINKANAKFIVVSFSKKTISMKDMKNFRRKWFDDILNKLKLEYELLDFENEYFYVIKF